MNKPITKHKIKISSINFFAFTNCLFLMYFPKLGINKFDKVTEMKPGITIKGRTYEFNIP